MHTAERIFTRQERKTALWALMMAALIATLGLVVQQWMQPSLGPDGVDAYAFAPLPGAAEARPVTEDASRFIVG